ncbi:MAG: dihydroorotase family protein [Actinomycetota bacterium]
MARYDTVIAGGTLVVPFQGEVRGDIAIKDGRIAAIADELGPADAADAIDARGKHVFPGAVDAHYHLGIYRDITEDTESETTSSLVGGATTVISYFRTGSHYLNRSGPYREIFPEVLEKVGGHSKVDYGFHLAPMTSEHIDEIPWLVEQGVSSFKYYMFYKGLNLSADSRDARAYTMAEEYDLGHLFEIMEAVAALDRTAGGRISVSLHCEQAELLRVFIERAKADPTVTGLAEYAAGRPPLTERLSIEEAGVLADATGVRVNLLHLSSAEALRTATDVRARYGLDANLECTVHHLALTHELLAGKGLGGKVNPPIRTQADVDALWDGVRDGRIGNVASDHACCMEENKGDDLWPALPGFGGTALLYPVLLSEGFHRRAVPLARLAEVASALPARAFNLSRKGRIEVGADADLAIVDVGLERTVTPELCRSAQDHTPFEGIPLRGWPVATLVRGTPMFRDGEVAKDWPGRYLARA